MAEFGHVHRVWEVGQQLTAAIDDYVEAISIKADKPIGDVAALAIGAFGPQHHQASINRLESLVLASVHLIRAGELVEGPVDLIVRPAYVHGS